MEALGRAARGPGRVYLTGGATALLHGWRGTTVDIDLRLDPEPAGAFEAIRHIKDQLDVNIELASPQDFIPELPGWRDRSLYITTVSGVSFYHYDPYAQALSKIERGHGRDLADVRAMAQHGLIETQRLWELFEAIVPGLERYPALDPAAFREAVEGAIETLHHDGRDDDS